MNRSDRIADSFGKALRAIGFMMVGFLIGITVMINVAGAPLPINVFFALIGSGVVFVAGASLSWSAKKR